MTNIYVCTSSININTPPSQIWEKIRNIRRIKTISQTTTIFKNNQTITYPQEIVEAFAEKFSYNSSNDNYTETFLRYKEEVEIK